MYKRGDLIIVPYPFTDLSSYKKRPCLVISSNEYNDSYDDIIVLPVSSSLYEDKYRIDISESDMKSGVLIKKSQIITDRVFTISQSIIIKKVGEIKFSIMEKSIEQLLNIINK